MPKAEEIPKQIKISQKSILLLNQIFQKLELRKLIQLNQKIPTQYDQQVDLRQENK